MKLAISFFFYSFIGNIAQSLCVAVSSVFGSGGKAINFLKILPITPVFGVGSLLTLHFLKLLKNPNAFTVFFAGIIIGTLTELVTGFLLIFLFGKNIWWNYDSMSFNLSGQICLLSSILFGLGSVILYFWLQPKLDKLLEYSTGSDFWWLIIMIFIFDAFYSLASYSQAFWSR